MSNSLNPDRTDILSVLIWVQSVYKDYEQTTLVGNELSKAMVNFLPTGYLLMLLLLSTDFFSKILSGTLSVSNRLDPDQD